MGENASARRDEARLGDGGRSRGGDTSRDGEADAGAETGLRVEQIEEVTTGSHANGFGRTDDGRSFAFRVHKNKLYLEVYRADSRSDVPDKSDVEAVAEHSITEIDLTDERSIVAAVRDAVSGAESVGVGRESTAVRAFFARVGSVIEGI